MTDVLKARLEMVRLAIPPSEKLEFTPSEIEPNPSEIPTDEFFTNRTPSEIPTDELFVYCTPLGNSYGRALRLLIPPRKYLNSLHPLGKLGRRGDAVIKWNGPSHDRCNVGNRVVLFQESNSNLV